MYKHPIILPCNDTICREHLFERNVIKENRLKCKACNEELGVKGYDFKSNEAIWKLIESHSYLNEEEMSLKRELEDSIRQFFEFYDEYEQKKAKLESDVFEHYQEMRFQIDEHRERIKKRIDYIALAMIDRTKKSEEEYLRNFKKRFSSFDDCKSLEHELNQIEETFRRPNLLIQTIQEMQRKHEQSLNEIQMKLNATTLIKDHLEATNEFKPNLSLLNKGGTSLFGLIKLNGCWLNLNSFKGQILTNERQSFELIKLCEFSPNDKWSLLYRGTRDGFGSDVFHSKCNGHSKTLTIFKAKESSYIFGGFTSVSWESSAQGKYKSDANAFIFSLTNKDSKPVKIKIDPNQHEYAICCHSSFGPIFGSGHDILIANNSNTTMKSYSNLGDSYKHPQYVHGTNEAESFLAGSYEFQLDEVEVYQKEE